MRRIVPLASLSAGVLLWSSAALAEPCNRPDLLAAMPPDDAIDVPTNVWLQAVYATRAEYLDEEILLTEVGGETRSLRGSFNAPEGLLTVTPPELSKGETYEIKWPALRGIATASKGDGATISFVVGTHEDTDAPEFSGLADIEWRWDHERDDCSDATDDRYVFEVGVGTASDDGGRESLTLIVFQTKGPSIDIPVPVYVGELPPVRDRVPITATVGEAVGEICFSALVRDLTGKVSSGSVEDVCVTTRPPPFFEGCTVTEAGAAAESPTRSRAAWLGAALLVAVTAASSRRRSRTLA